MKKLRLFLGLVLIIILFTGCGSNAKEESTKANKKNNSMVKKKEIYDQGIISASRYYEKNENGSKNVPYSISVDLNHIDTKSGKAKVLRTFRFGNIQTVPEDNILKIIPSSFTDFSNIDRKHFNSDFSLIACEIALGEDFSGKGVGFCDEDSNYVNVSKIISDETSPAHEYSHFYQGRFWFYDMHKESWFSVPLENITKENVKNEGYEGLDGFNGFNFYDILYEEYTDPYNMEYKCGLFDNTKVLDKFGEYSTKKEFIKRKGKVKSVSPDVPGTATFLIGNKNAPLVFLESKTEEEENSFYIFNIKTNKLKPLPEFSWKKDIDGDEYKDIFIQWNN
ncbi:hypothetical protein [Enterococcus sp. AZ007]|uniref:hypothetical protein n=1 Tax=Enterococcus sp. AZ007 TaxID=2774839 RepID=UPI003F270DFD